MIEFLESEESGDEKEKTKQNFVTKLVESTGKSDVETYRVSATTKAEALKWLNIYQKRTRTHWIVDKTFPQPERYQYRHIFKCNLSKRNKTPDGIRNQHCPATLEIKIKLVTKDTKKKDRFIGKNDPPLPGIVTVNSKHNHHIDVCDNMQYLRGDADLRETFETYFGEMSPDQAMRLHEEKLSLKENGEVLKADGHYNPRANTVYWWHKEWRKKNFGPPQEPLKTLMSKCQQYEADGTTVVVSEESPWCVLLCTPLMKRAHTLPSAKEIIFVDSTGTVDASHSNVTVISTATKIGAVPLCILMHENQTIEGYKKAFQMFKDTFPTAFGGETHPEVFMTDNSSTEKPALKYVWPEAIQLLCHFHVIQQEWTWLLSSKHNVERTERQSLIMAFKKIMYSRTTEEFEENKIDFVDEASHEGYVKRVEEFLKRKEEWVSLFRDHLLMRGHHTNNFSEATIRILKDVILKRVKAYNLVALVNYIVTVWENYMKTRILRVAYNRDSRAILVYESLLRKMDPELVKRIEKVDEHTYMVPSAKTSELLYEVNRSLGVCNCKAGCTGAFCKHQALLYSAYGGYFPNAPPLLSTDRYQLGLLALGSKCPPATFFLGMKEGLEGGTPMTQEPGYIAEIEMAMEQSTVMIQQGSEDGAATVELDAHTESKYTAEQKEEILKSFSSEWERYHKLAENEDSYFEYLTKATKEMKRVTSGSGAVGAVVKINDALKGYSSSSVRLGQIGVQAKSIARRPPEAPKTSKRLAPGRKPGKKSDKNVTPDKNKNSTKKKVKRVRQIAESIRNNIAHVKTH